MISRPTRKFYILRTPDVFIVSGLHRFFLYDKQEGIDDPHIPTGDFKVAFGVCFALKSWTEYLLLFTYLIILGTDVTFPLITKFKTNKFPSYLSVNRIPN